MLYPFQTQGVKFLHNRPRAILADDLGLGKTVQALWSLGKTKDGPALVICPKALIPEWVSAVRQWLPNWVPYLVRETDDKGFKMLCDRKSKKAKRSIGIINYAGLQAVMKPLSYVPIQTAIVDEAHYIKNRKARRSRQVRELTRWVRNLYLLTGSPPYYRPEELWHMLHVIAPRAFSSFWSFFERHVKYWTAPTGGKVPTGIRDLDAYVMEIEPFVLRRAKAEVAPDLPTLRQAPVPAQLGPGERRRYDTVRNNKLETPEGDPIVFPNVLSKLNTLRKMATSSWLITEQGKPDCAKLDVLIEKVTELGDEPFVVFTHFRKTKWLVIERLNAAEVTNTTVNDIEPWHAGERQALVDTVYKGGVGLNLQRAAHLFLLEPPKGYPDYVQAQGRIHRIGSTRPCTVWHLYADDTVDFHFFKHLHNLGDKATEVELALAVWKDVVNGTP